LKRHPKRLTCLIEECESAGIYVEDAKVSSRRKHVTFGPPKINRKVKKIPILVKELAGQLRWRDSEIVSLQHGICLRKLVYQPREKTHTK